jgi:hypothetical protein
MTSYLIVNQWQGDKLKNQNMPELYKRVELFGKKARVAAEKYETQLNKADFNADKNAQIKAITENKIWYSVTAIPDSQAREYNSYPSWEDCPIFEG